MDKTLNNLKSELLLAFKIFLSILYLALPETVGNFWCRNVSKS